MDTSNSALNLDRVSLCSKPHLTFQNGGSFRKNFLVLKEWYINVLIKSDWRIINESQPQRTKASKELKTVNMKSFTYIYHNNKIKTNQILLMCSYFFWKLWCIRIRQVDEVLETIVKLIKKH